MRSSRSSSEFLENIDDALWEWHFVVPHYHCWQQLGVSENRGYPQIIRYLSLLVVNHPFLSIFRVPYDLRNTKVSISCFAAKLVLEPSRLVEDVEVWVSLMCCAFANYPQGLPPDQVFLAAAATGSYLPWSMTDWAKSCPCCSSARGCMRAHLPRK